MSAIVGIIMMVLMAVLGGVPTVYMVVSLVAVICQKVYGKVRYGKSLYD